MDVFDLYAKIALDSSEYDSGLDAAASKSESIGSKIGGALGTAGKIAGVAVAAVGTAIGATTTALVNGVSSVAEYGDNIDKMSQKMGLTAEAYQEWDAVMQHSGTSMETMKASMKTLANAAETNNKAFKELGITEKDLASMNQQELFEATIAGLQNVEDTTQRTYLAGKLLGRGATELGALLNTSAEDTQAMRDRVRELGGVMSEDAVKSAAAFQDQLQDLQTGFAGVKRGLMSELLPSITQVMSGLTDIFAGDYDEGLSKISDGVNATIDKISEILPKALEIGGQIVGQIATAIMNNLPQIATAALNLIGSFGSYILDNIGTITQTAVNIVTTLASGLSENLPTLIPAIVEAVLTIQQTLIENAPMLLEAGIELFTGLAEGFVNAIPVIIEKLPEIIQSIVDAIITGLPLLIDASIQLVNGIVAALPEIISALVEALPEIINAIVQGLITGLPMLIEGSIQLVLALVAALPEIMQALYDAMPEIFMTLVEAIIENQPLITEAFMNMFLNVGQMFYDAGAQWVEFLGSALSNLVSTAEQWLAQLPERAGYYAGLMVAKFIEFITQLPSKAMELFDQVMTNVKNFGDKLVAEAPKMAGDFKDKLIAKLKEIPPKMIEIGAEIVEGLKNGISSAWESFKSWMGEMVSGFIEGVKEGLKIGSPSKVMADEVGKWIPAGIAVGIEDNMGVLDKTMNAVYDNIVPDFNTNTGGGTSGVNLGEIVQLLRDIRDNDVKVVLEGDADRLFRVMQAKATSNYRLTGNNSLVTI